ncbi:hypothetical protein AURDEDRAFT_180678 [Auricularia subglabra TFB-10046 SS5]|nr:hypothetical protein AURDEDRAFT_180678 [Auricularia subglabra TFB-10046 SS5]
MAEMTVPVEAENQQTLPPAADQARERAIDVPPVQFLHVANELALEDAVRELKYATHIFLDCEGYQLGAVGGSMSLINVSCGPDGVVYVVDATCFERDALEPLFELFRNPEIKKVMFDGRMDASEFMHGYNIELEGVLDMQLADITGRYMRGEGPREQLARLRPFIHPRDMIGHESDYLGVHRLNGLVKCMEEFRLPVVRRNEAYHNRWQERPLPNAMLLAAARDVCYIRTLWEHFISRGWVSQGELEAQSARYVALVRGMRPYQWDSYRCNGLLPQGILADWRGGPNETQAPWTCELCERELARCCFLQIAHYRPDRRFCATCRALRIRQLRGEERQQGDRSNIWQASPSRPLVARGMMPSPFFD